MAADAASATTVALGRCCVREGVVEALERLSALAGRQLEGGAASAVDDDDQERTLDAVPDEEDVEAVAGPVRKLLGGVVAVHASKDIARAWLFREHDEGDVPGPSVRLRDAVRTATRGDDRRLLGVSASAATAASAAPRRRGVRMRSTCIGLLLRSGVGPRVVEPRLG
jgi:hypothetical protein